MYPYTAAVIFCFVVPDRGTGDLHSLPGYIGIDSSARIGAGDLIVLNVAFLYGHSGVGIDTRTVAARLVAAEGYIPEADLCGLICAEETAACFGSVI